MTKRQKKDTNSLEVWLNRRSPPRKVDNIRDSFNEKQKNPYKKIDYKRVLNLEQQKVVSNLTGNMLVKSGAGTGKTRVITYSVARLLEMGAEPSEIMLVTFTNKAAKEMINRVKELLGVMPVGITAGTFHSIAHRVFLKRFKKKIKFENYTIMNTSQTNDFIDMCIDDACNNELLTNEAYANIDPEEEDEIFKDIKDSYPTANAIRQIISARVNCNKTLKNVIQWKFQEYGAQFDQIYEIANRYTNKKMKKFMFDFDDLLFFWNRLLDDADVKEFAKKFKYILVDEYQDTNYIQDEIIQKLSKLNEEHCLLAVGDDAQSIYAFRGADFRNFLNFKDNFENVEEFTISINYRSSPEILALANDSINHNKFQFPKEMKPNKPGLHKPRLIIAKNNYKLVDYLVEKVKNVHANGIPYEKIAILFRALKGDKPEIQHYHRLIFNLTKEDIPYEVRGGQTFFEKMHIRDILAFLRFRYDPKGMFAKKYFARIATKYIEGLGKTNSDKIYDEIIIKSKAPFDVISNPLSLTRKIDLLKHKGVFNRRPPVHNIVRIMKILLSLKGTVGDMIKALIQRKVIYNVFEGKYKEKEQEQDFEKKINDIKLLIEMTTRFRTLGEFLNHLSLNESEYDQNRTINEKESRLVISTIHRAKGLEWNTVFMPMLTDGFFPDYLSLKRQEDLEEERRIFYVAVTRTEEDLYLASAELDDDGNENALSQFVDELNKKLYEKIYIDD